MKEKYRAFVLAVLAACVLCGCQKEQNTPDTDAVRITAPPEKESSREMETDIPEQTAESSDETDDRIEEKEKKAAAIKIKGLPDEVLRLMGTDEKRLEKEIKIYANEMGYAEAEQAVYTGETVIDHTTDTICISFYFDTDDNYKFYSYYNRTDKTFSFQEW